MQAIDKNISNKIANLSFVCVCLVVGIHSGWSDGYGSVVSFGKRLVVEGLGQVAVPWFFVVSGFLMAGHFNDDYFWKNEFTKRMRSLLVPYLAWSLIGFTSLALLAICADVAAHREWYMTLTANPRWIACIFGLDFSQAPTLYPLWYVRCLLVFALFAGFLRWVVRGLGVFWILIVYALYWVQILWWQNPVFSHGFSLSGLFYFSVGMWLRAKRISVNVSSVFGVLSLVVGLFMIIYRAAIYSHIPPLFRNWAPVCVPLCLIGAYSIIPVRSLPQSIVVLTFPMFLIHVIVNSYVGAVMKHLIGLKIAEIMCVWFLGILLSGCVAYILKRTRLNSILFGGR